MELLVRVIDRSDRVDDSKRGDVIVARPDNWPWSAQERTNPAWRILKADLTPAEVSTLLASPLPPPIDLQNPPPPDLTPRPRRTAKLNLDALMPETVGADLAALDTLRSEATASRADEVILEVDPIEIQPNVMSVNDPTGIVVLDRDTVAGAIVVK